jgi:small-conductance mechanosensitive channel
LGTGPFYDGGEQEAARLLRQLTDYTSTIVRQEIRRAQLHHEPTHDHAPRRDGRLTVGGLIGILGLATLIAAGVIMLAHTLGAGLAAAVIGAALLAVALGLILSGTRRPARASPPDGRRRV